MRVNNRHHIVYLKSDKCKKKIKVLLDKRIGGICKAQSLLDRVVWVNFTENGKFEPRQKEDWERAMW